MQRREKSKKRKWFETKTDVIVLVRSVIEFAIIGFVIFMLVRLFVSRNEFDHYDAYDENAVSGEDRGFICLSYLGLDRSGTDTLVSVDNYEQQLSILRSLGYVSITQQDIIDYYEKGEPLPEKALFLVFEDGRVDTALYSQPALEKNNYIATMASYADNLEINDSKKLSAEDLKKLDKSSFWENGTNGYRLSYINVFDRYGSFLGEMDSLEYNSVKKYLGREYNHYLMDYYRDEDYMPVESYSEMKDRISYDYELMKDIYTKELGYVPQLYILMHSNTDMFGNNERVSEVNRENMEKLFSLNINREGYSLNTADTDMFDLTRLQVQPYWSVNHLLMRMWDDLDEEDRDSIKFVKGDRTRGDKWETEYGVSEFEENRIYLVSLPDRKGVVSLKDSSEYKDIEVETTLTGNYCGEQSVLLRSDDKGDGGIKVTFYMKEMIVTDGGTEIARVDLDKIMGVQYASVEEDKKAALAGEYKMRAGSAGSWEESMAYSMEEKEISKQAVRTVNDGAEAYVPVIESYLPAKWSAVISLKDDRLNVSVNGYAALTDLKVNTLTAGKVRLEAAVPKEDEYNQRNISDDVYEGRFDDLVMSSLDAENQDEVLYDNRLHGKEYAGHAVNEWWNKTIDWFVENL